MTLAPFGLHDVGFALGWGIVAAGCVFDLRERIFPNALACALALAAFAASALAGAALGQRLLWATAVTAALFASELVFRRLTGTSGLGMGDVKFVGAASLAFPFSAPVAFAGGCALLAVWGLVRRQDVLPAIPFVAVALALVVAAQIAGGSSLVAVA